MDVTNQPLGPNCIKEREYRPQARKLLRWSLAHQDLVTAFCECYQLARAHFAFHLPKTYA